MFFFRSNGNIIANVAQLNFTLGFKTKGLEHLRRFSSKGFIIIHNYGPQSIGIPLLIAQSQTQQFPAIISKVTVVIYT